MSMKMTISRFVFGLAALALGAAEMLTAQAPNIAVEHGTGPGITAGAGPGMAEGFDGGESHGFGMRALVTGAPYSAVRTTTRVETLANGSTITHTSQVKEARDSSGRTYLESLPSTEEGGQAQSFVRVIDPVNRVSISWSSNAKQATLVHLPEPGQFAGARGMAAGANAGANERPARLRGNSDGVTTESLGSKTINVVVADGTRVTRVIPAGKMGNSEALTITHDTWVSQDLKLEVERVDTDPRFGTTTVEVTNLSREEPSPALFQAPAGFAVKELSAGARRGGGFGGFEAAP
jgi:hypothetical protein